MAFETPSRPSGETFADRLRSARTAGGTSTRQLSSLLGFSHSLVATLESGRVAPSAAALKQLSLTLGCSVDWLLMGQGEPPLPEAVQAAVARARTRQSPSLPATGTEG